MLRDLETEWATPGGNQGGLQSPGAELLRGLRISHPEGVIILITSRDGIHSGEASPAELPPALGSQSEKDMEELEQVQRRPQS